MDNPALIPKLVMTSPAVMSGGRPQFHSPRSQWVAEVVGSGHYEIRADGGPWMRLGPEDGVLYRPGVSFEERVPKGICRSYYVIFAFDDRQLERPLCGGHAVCRLRDTEGLAYNCLDRLQSVGADSALDRLARQSFLSRLVWLLATAEPREGVHFICESETPGASVSTRADLYMRRNLKKCCHIADIAKHIGLSSSGLQHAYRRETGQSPAKAFRRMRIEKAKAMLLRGGMTLETIAGETGFGDGCHLSRAFKAQEGLSPRQFRNQFTEHSRMVP